MFSTMFKSLFTNEKKKKKSDDFLIVNIAYKEKIESKLTELNEQAENSVVDDNVIDAFDLMSIADTQADIEIINNGSVDNFEDSKSEISSIGENEPSLQDTDSAMKRTINQINSLQCLFTWNIKPNNRRNIILMVQNKYGDYNLDISSPEFTLQRFVGNLIIAYELFHKGDTELGQMKVLEIGKWLEDLDNLNTDLFYLSISTGLKHVMSGTFIHMLFATNLIGECKWLLESLTSFANMDPKSRAAVHAVRAVVLNEYGGNPVYLKKAIDCAKKACDLDPNTSYWFYVYSLALTAHRHFLLTRKSKPNENEINSIQQAILLSDGKNTLFNYHRMTLDRDTAIRYYHDNKNLKDKSVYQKNLQDNKILVQMIKTIIDMDPKDPLLFVNCAKTIMTLPIMVRDFKLGKQYLTKALKMAPNDKAVFEAVEKTIVLYQEINKSAIEKKLSQPLKTKGSKLGEELAILVKKYRKGDDLIPHFTNLITKYNGMDQCKLIAQFCSYYILFANNLKNGIEQFIRLIEQPEMINNFLITQHFSSFGTKKFNLAELICNEIRLATNASGTSSDDMLFYYKTLTKIVETCNIKMKDVDPSMKNKLIVDLSSGATNTNKSHQSDTDSSDTESVDKKDNKIQKPKNRRAKPSKTTDTKTLNKQPKWNKRSNKKNVTNPTNLMNTTKNVPNVTKKNQINVDNLDEMKYKMAKFLCTAETNHGMLNNVNPTPPLLPNNIRNIQTQEDIDRYTHQLYENILNRRQQQNNFSPPYYLNNIHSFLNQTDSNPGGTIQQPPSLLSLRPQINQQVLQKPQTKKNPNKKK